MEELNQEQAGEVTATNEEEIKDEAKEDIKGEIKEENQDEVKEENKNNFSETLNNSLDSFKTKAKSIWDTSLENTTVFCKKAFDSSHNFYDKVAQKSGDLYDTAVEKINTFEMPRLKINEERSISSQQLCIIGAYTCAALGTLFYFVLHLDYVALAFAIIGILLGFKAYLTEDDSYIFATLVLNGAIIFLIFFRVILSFVFSIILYAFFGAPNS